MRSLPLPLSTERLTLRTFRPEDAAADGVAPQSAASPGVMAAPVQPEGDSQAIAFNPAQIKAADLEGAHNALDPDRVARLLGLLD